MSLAALVALALLLVILFPRLLGVTLKLVFYSVILLLFGAVAVAIYTI